MAHAPITNLLGYTAAVLASCMFIPQISKIWKSRDAGSISMVSVTLLVIVSALWSVYGVLVDAVPIAAVNVIIGLLAIARLVLKLRFDSEQRSEP
jgi:MtN3 and saliva related transmembrane protein